MHITKQRTGNQPPVSFWTATVLRMAIAPLFTDRGGRCDDSHCRFGWGTRRGWLIHCVDICKYSKTRQHVHGPTGAMAGRIGVCPAPTAERHFARRCLHHRIRMHAFCVGPHVAHCCKTSTSILGQDARRMNGSK